MKKYHLIGIGGIGMSGIARLLAGKGARVSGSDARQSRTTDELAALGCQIDIGHRAGNVGDCDEVIFSSAIREDNPEMREARRRGIAVRRRAEALAELMGDKKVITVSGAHGKTTTSSLVSHLLMSADLSPTVVVGGIVKNFGNNVCSGKGEFFVAEADESDGSFLCYRPTYSIITNIDREHLDFYGDFSRLLEAFGVFMKQTSSAGCLFCCGHDAYLGKLLASCKRRSVVYGFDAGFEVHACSIRLKDLSSEFDCYRRGQLLGRFKLNLGGSHNVCNSLAVIALGMELGIGIGTIARALETYQGTGRRLEIKLRTADWTVIDDYAHHPTEIKATLNALSQIECKRRVIVFQPHRYSRTKLLLEEFGSCFAAADRVIITDIYAASEQPIEGISAELIVEKIIRNFPDKMVEYVSKDKLCERVLATVEPKDLIATLGAGDITKISDEIAAKLEKRS
jgi:UDP-N-acetylmuramate--alanine ligase